MRCLFVWRLLMQYMRRASQGIDASSHQLPARVEMLTKMEQSIARHHQSLSRALAIQVQPHTPAHTYTHIYTHTSTHTQRESLIRLGPAGSRRSREGYYTA